MYVYIYIYIYTYIHIRYVYKDTKDTQKSGESSYKTSEIEMIKSKIIKISIKKVSVCLRDNKKNKSNNKGHEGHAEVGRAFVRKEQKQKERTDRSRNNNEQ